jgi:hypothetical protein
MAIPPKRLMICFSIWMAIRRLFYSMKARNAFVSFIDWDTSELFKEERLGANTIALFFRHADNLVQSESKKSRPEVVNSAVDVHRLAWFTDRDDGILLASIFEFFRNLLNATRKFNEQNREDGIPPMRFSAGLSEGRLSLDVKTKLFVGDAVDSANVCAERSRDTGHFLVVNPAVFKREDWAGAIERALKIKVENELIPIDPMALEFLANHRRHC